jgi:hypothetical protein
MTKDSLSRSAAQMQSTARACNIADHFDALEAEEQLALAHARGC